eukprot:1175135-Pleurochrysis_carterae.AAC.1
MEERRVGCFVSAKKGSSSVAKDCEHVEPRTRHCHEEAARRDGIVGGQRPALVDRVQDAEHAVQMHGARMVILHRRLLQECVKRCGRAVQHVRVPLVDPTPLLWARRQLHCAGDAGREQARTAF